MTAQFETNIEAINKQFEEQVLRTKRIFEKIMKDKADTVIQVNNIALK